MWPFAPWGCCEKQSHRMKVSSLILSLHASLQLMATWRLLEFNSNVQDVNTRATPSRSAALSASTHGHGAGSLPLQKVLTLRLSFLSPAWPSGFHMGEFERWKTGIMITIIASQSLQTLCSRARMRQCKPSTNTGAVLRGRINSYRTKSVLPPSRHPGDSQQTEQEWASYLVLSRLPFFHV